MKIVIFDFDKTLTIKDSLAPFANYIAKKRSDYLKLFLFYFSLFIYKLKCVNDKTFKEFFLKLFIRDLNTIDVEKIVREFFNDKLKYLINEKVFNKLENHIVSGDTVYIVSANFDFFLEPIIKIWNLSGVISTQAEKKNSCFTGKIIGNTCKGEDKLRKIETILGYEKLREAIAYGDKQDIYLLKSVAEGIEIP